MKNPFVLLLLLAAGSLSAQEAAPPSAPPPPELTAEERLQALDAEQIEAAIEALRTKHIEAEAIDEPAVRRATLRGLLEGLQPGAELAGVAPEAKAAVPFFSEILGERTGYIRPGSLGTENIARLDAALQEFRGKKVDAVVLDLRAASDGGDFEIAAQFAGRFAPPSASLFVLSGETDKNFTAAGPRAFDGVVAVLVDADTAGAAEAIAASLRVHAKAMLVGAQTSGRAVEFDEVDLGDGQRLRWAAAEVRVESLPAIYPGGLEPDLAVEQDAATRDAIFAGMAEKGAAAFVFQTEREQLNEAALVAGTNPEISAGEENGAALIDRPLQSAVDLVTAIRLFDGRN
jgi:hypothetical protein